MSESIWNDPRITAYVLGEMTEEERSEFETEVASNSELASAVDEARMVTDQLSSLYEAEKVPALDPTRRAAIIAPGPFGPLSGGSMPWTRVGLLLAIAATALAIVGVASVMNRMHNERIARLQMLRSEMKAEAKSQVIANELAVSADLAKKLESLNRERPALQQRFAQQPRQFSRENGVAVSASNDKQAEPWLLYRTPNSEAKVEFVERNATREAIVDKAAIATAPASSPALGDSRLRRLSESNLALGSEAQVGQALGGANPRTKTDFYFVESEAAAGLAEAAALPSLAKATSLSRGLQPGQQPGDYGLPMDEGRGPGIAGDRFDPITDNPFQRVSEHPLSTFSVDVDTASYSKVRDYLMRANQLPRPDAVRIEELVNYFSYNYEPPADSAEHPFAARVNVTSCPWNESHRLARIAIKGKTMEPENRPQCNLVFLLDTSGSMNAPNKLPLVIEGMQLLLKQLNDEDKVAITVYAGSAGLVLDSTPAKKEKKIRKALTELSAGGSTNGGAGIALAYQTARDHFLPEGVNRVILCTDGDFNVGTTGTDELVRMVEQEAKGGIFLSVFGFGMGNHNDAMLEQISGRGNGNYAFIDSRNEARKVLVEQTNGTLVTIAKDVKLQIEFNPTQVSSYRLIGYENRVLAKEDFNDDKKDAGEIGAGHSVTALYEIVPAGTEPDAIAPKVDDLKYQDPAQPSSAADSEELMTLKLRYKQPDGDTSTLVEFPVVDEGGSFADADDDVRFVAAVASFGMQLRRSPYAGNWTMSDAMNTANRAKGDDRDGLRAEFVTLVQKASELMGEQ